MSTIQTSLTRGAGRRASRRGRLVASIALAFLVIPSAAACATSDPDTGADGGGGATELTVGSLSIYSGLDPYDQGLASSIVYHSFYDFLIEYDDDLNPVPEAASSWEIADDNMSMTITLQEATFHSGEPVTADDIVAGIDRQLDPATARNMPVTWISRATAVDDRTVHVEFTGPTVEGRILDWMFDFPVIEAESNDEETLLATEAGSGPFMLESFVEGINLVMVRNPDYWKPNLPTLERITIKSFDDVSAMVSALKAGDVQTSHFLTLSLIDSVRDDFDLQMGSELAKMQTIWLNTKEPPFDNELVRQGIMRAINHERIIADANFGAGVPTYSVISPSSPAWSDEAFESVSFDLDAARDLFERSGAELSGSITYRANDTVRGAILQIVQADLKEAGFDLTVEPMERTAQQSLQDAGDISYITPSDGNFRNPGHFLELGLAATGNPLWPDGKAPQDWADALEAVNNAFTDEDRAAAYEAMNRALIKHAWVIGTSTHMYPFATAKNVHGVKYNPRGQFIFDEVTID